MIHERFKHQVRAARHLALDAPISDYDARGLVHLISETLKAGATFDRLVAVICGTPEGASTVYCSNIAFTAHQTIGFANLPPHTAVGPDGSVWVADEKNARVCRFVST